MEEDLNVERPSAVFAPADYPLIKKALHSYLVDCVRTQDSEREPHPDLSKIANLLHRIGRVDGTR